MGLKNVRRPGRMTVDMNVPSKETTVISEPGFQTVRKLAVGFTALASMFGVAGCGTSTDMAAGKGQGRSARQAEDPEVAARVEANRAAITGGTIDLPETAWPQGSFSCTAPVKAVSDREFDINARVQVGLDHLRATDETYAAALDDTTADDELLKTSGLVVHDLCDGWVAYMSIQPVGDKVEFFRDPQHKLSAGWVSADLMKDTVSALAMKAQRLRQAG